MSFLFFFFWKGNTLRGLDTVHGLLNRLSLFIFIYTKLVFKCVRILLIFHFEHILLNLEERLSMHDELIISGTKISKLHNCIVIVFVMYFLSWCSFYMKIVGNHFAKTKMSLGTSRFSNKDVYVLSSIIDKVHARRYAFRTILERDIHKGNLGWDFSAECDLFGSSRAVVKILDTTNGSALISNAMLYLRWRHINVHINEVQIFRTFFLISSSSRHRSS